MPRYPKREPPQGYAVIPCEVDGKRRYQPLRDWGIADWKRYEALYRHPSLDPVTFSKRSDAVRFCEEVVAGKWKQ